MAEDVSLQLQERTVTGKAVKHLRREGLLPGVIHDHGKPSIPVMAKYIDVFRIYQRAGKHHPIYLSVGNKTFTALIKTAEFEPRKHQLNHVVFGAVKADEKVTAEVPIKLTDEIPAEKVSLIVIHQLEAVEVEAFPQDLPDELVVDASSLVEIGDKLTVANITPPKGVTILTEPEHAVATVYEPSALAAANDALAGEAEAEDAEYVESDNESGVVEEDQKPEDQPGGKKQFEAKGE